MTKSVNRRRPLLGGGGPSVAFEALRATLGDERGAHWVTRRDEEMMARSILWRLYRHSIGMLTLQMA